MSLSVLEEKRREEKGDTSSKGKQLLKIFVNRHAINTVVAFALVRNIVTRILHFFYKSIFYEVKSSIGCVNHFRNFKKLVCTIYIYYFNASNYTSSKFRPVFQALSIISRGLQINLIKIWQIFGK